MSTITVVGLQAGMAYTTAVSRMGTVSMFRLIDALARPQLSSSMVMVTV